MGRAIKRHVPDRVKSSGLWRSGLSVRVLRCQQSYGNSGRQRDISLYTALLNSEECALSKKKKESRMQVDGGGNRGQSW